MAKKIGFSISSSLVIILVLVAISSDKFAGHSDFGIINGVSLEAPRNSFDAESLNPVVEVGSEWIAIIPYAYSNADQPNVTFRYQRQYWGESPTGAQTSIDHAKSLGLKIMIKPHIWVRGQGWPGDFELHTEEDWITWEKDYTAYILTYAKIAQEKQVELFCIGTEYRKLVAQKPDAWRRIIKKVRSEYSGKITYAANWDNYENVDFWDELDYIGIDAYFPLDEAKNPTVDGINRSWKPTKDSLSAFSDRWNRPILFTEYGYQSVDYAAAGHWKHNQDTLDVNYLAQANAYESLYQTFWDEEWFKGGFLWKWHVRSNIDIDQRRRQRSRNYLEKRFTPQGKLAEEVIKEWYTKNQNK